MQSVHWASLIAHWVCYVQIEQAKCKLSKPNVDWASLQIEQAWLPNEHTTCIVNKPNANWAGNMPSARAWLHAEHTNCTVNTPNANWASLIAHCALQVHNEQAKCKLNRQFARWASLIACQVHCNLAVMLTWKLCNYRDMAKVTATNLRFNTSKAHYTATILLAWGSPSNNASFISSHN